MSYSALRLCFTLLSHSIFFFCFLMHILILCTPLFPLLPLTTSIAAQNVGIQQRVQLASSALALDSTRLSLSLFPIIIVNYNSLVALNWPRFIANDIKPKLFIYLLLFSFPFPLSCYLPWYLFFMCLRTFSRRRRLRALLNSIFIVKLKLSNTSRFLFLFFFCCTLKAHKKIIIVSGIRCFIGLAYLTL